MLRASHVHLNRTQKSWIQIEDKIIVQNSMTAVYFTTRLCIALQWDLEMQFITHLP